MVLVGKLFELNCTACKKQVAGVSNNRPSLPNPLSTGLMAHQRSISYLLVGQILRSPYKFSLPFESYSETCTSCYEFLGLKSLTSCWVRHWTPTLPRSCSSASRCRKPPPWHHYRRHTTGSKCTSWFVVMRHLWRALVLFLNVAKLLILSCRCSVAIVACID
jgi:hypothetical protein